MRTVVGHLGHIYIRRQEGVSISACRFKQNDLPGRATSRSELWGNILRGFCGGRRGYFGQMEAVLFSHSSEPTDKATDPMIIIAYALLLTSFVMARRSDKPRVHVLYPILLYDRQTNQKVAASGIKLVKSGQYHSL